MKQSKPLGILLCLMANAAMFGLFVLVEAGLWTRLAVGEAVDPVDLSRPFNDRHWRFTGMAAAVAIMFFGIDLWYITTRRRDDWLRPDMSPVSYALTVIRRYLFVPFMLAFAAVVLAWGLEPKVPVPPSPIDPAEADGVRADAQAFFLLIASGIMVAGLVLARRPLHWLPSTIFGFGSAMVQAFGHGMRGSH